MTKSEWEALMETWGDRSVDGEAAGLLRALLEVQETAATLRNEAKPAASTEVQRIIVQQAAEARVERASVDPTPTAIVERTIVQPAVQAGVERSNVQRGVESLVDYPQRTVQLLTQPQSTRSSSNDDGGSVAGEVIKTIGMVTGVGPVVTGLLKLFGGDDGKPREPEYAPIPFSLPDQVSVEAGLASDRSFTGIGYAANGGVRGLNSSRPNAPSSSQPIQINVQAMDSRSFVDHSDENARAVREALLQSHSLNDVIADL
jgi:hypothetical protein